MSKGKCGRLASTVFALAAVLSAVAIAPADAAQTTCQQTPPRVAVDVGHSLKRPGATSARGKNEFLFNQRFARELVALAQTTKDLELILINGDGQIGGLQPRVRQTEKAGADVFLSIHHDSAQPMFFKPWTFEGRERFYADQFSGFSLFVSRENPQFVESVRLAKQIGDAWLGLGIPRTLHHAAPIKGENRELLDRKRGVYEAPFFVVREATLPAVLVEVGVLVSRDEEQRLETADYRKRMQVALLEALKQFCGSARSN
ncbi:MAG: N-acetylmuramoyl-L-alanine amidase family protein [Hyphomicrobiaceae bacterium]